MDSWPTPPEALRHVTQDTSFAKISRISRSINNFFPKGDAFFRASGMPIGGGRFNSVERKSFLTENPTTRRSAFKVSCYFLKFNYFILIFINLPRNAYLGLVPLSACYFFAQDFWPHSKSLL